jgi:predicted outer membrane repeat protein
MQREVVMTATSNNGEPLSNAVLPPKPQLIVAPQALCAPSPLQPLDMLPTIETCLLQTHDPKTRPPAAAAATSCRHLRVWMRRCRTPCILSSRSPPYLRWLLTRCALASDSGCFSRAPKLRLMRPQHSTSMVASHPLIAFSSNRACNGGALESNGIIVGNKDEFKEVSRSLHMIVCSAQRAALEAHALTRTHSTRSGARTAWTRATFIW